MPTEQSMQDRCLHKPQSGLTGLPYRYGPCTEYKAETEDESRNVMICMNPQPDTGEVLAGLVERVYNAENGFCVLRARARGHRDVVTVVGHAAALRIVTRS